VNRRVFRTRIIGRKGISLGAFRATALTVTTAVLVSLLGTGTVAAAAPARGHGVQPAQTRPVPVTPVHGRGGQLASGHIASAARHTTWPAAGTATVPLGAVTPAVSAKTPAAGGTAVAAVRAGSLPVTLTPVAPGVQSRTATQTAPGTGSASATAGTASVQVLPQSSSTKLGVRGVILSLTRTDHQSGGRSARVALNYSAFRDAYGAGWGSRLKFFTMPACALTTPQLPACRTMTPLSSANQAVAGQLTATVTLPAATAAGGVTSHAATSAMATAVTPMVLAAQATGSGDGGTFSGASQLTPDGQWSAGSGAGGFSWSYPISIPTVPGGLQPSLGLGYNSQAVDGHTSATSPQAAWVGDGWSDTQNFIERDFIPCSQDADTTSKNNTTPTGDLCWSDAADTLTLSLNGSSNTLVHDPKTGWHAQNDNGEQIQVKTDTVNGDHANQYWVVTVGDTSYYFGLNRLPGWATGNPVTNSVATVPVYGNDPGEPCNATTFAASSCQQAYRWNLDYVVDAHSDAISYWYQQATNYYGANNGTTPVSYIRDTWLDHINYGQRVGHLFDATQPAATVTFTVADRCDSSQVNCSTVTLASNPSDYPDIPYDQNCASTGTCNNHGPSFWTTKELTGVRTTELVGTTQTPVDSWAFSYSFPPTGDATPPSLWLNQIQRTGLVGGNAPLNPVVFTPRMLANRVQSLTGYQPYTRGRIYKVTTETGSVVQVNYENSQNAYGTNPAIPACDNRVGTSVVLPGSEDTNTWLCYPAYWTPPGKTSPIEDWFNKYVVSGITQSDPTASGPTTETDYSYAGGGAWHFDDSPGTQAQYRTWDQWRGFAQVDTRTGSPTDTHTLSSAFFFRGMDGDKTKTGTRSIVLNDLALDDPQHDAAPLAGRTFETRAYNGDGGALLADTVTDPWLGPITATQDRTAVGLSALTAQQVNASRVRTTTTKAGGANRTTETDTTFDPTTGLPTQVDDKGDISTTADDRCTKTTYAKDTSGNLLPTPVRITTLNITCSATPSYPANLVSDEQVFYDGSTTAGTAPTLGDVTRVDKASAVDTSGNPTWVTVEQNTYDQYGRPLTTTNGDSRTTTTAYTPATGASPTEVDATLPLVSGQTAGFTTKTYLDPTRGETVKTVDAAGYVTSQTYDPLGRLTAVWDPGYSQTANPNQPNTKYSYNLSSSAPSTVTVQALNDDGSYRTQISIYDAMLRERETQTGTVDGGRNITDSFYDSHGWVNQTDDAYYAAGAPSGTLVQAPDNQVPSSHGFVHDGLGRVTDSIAYHDAAQTWDTKTAYPGSDETDVTPPAGGTRTSTFTDARGHTVELQQFPATGSPDTVTYGYDASGNLVSQTDQATATIPAHTWTWTYDLLGRNTVKRDPDSGTTTSVIDNAGLVTSTTDARGKQISYTYDAMGRKIGSYDTTTTSFKTAANRLTAYTYDTLGAGLPVSQTSYYGGNAYVEGVSSYDTSGRPTGTSTTIPSSEGALAGTYSTSYSYSYTGLVNSYTDSAAGNLASETVSNVHNGYGQLTGVNSAAWDYVDKILYNEYGQATQLTYGPSTNFAQQTLTLDDQTGRLTDATLTTQSGAATADHTTYGYSNSQVSPGSGLITSITDQQNPGATTGAVTDTQCFTYDYLQRLSSAWTATDNCTATPTPGSSATVGGPNPYWQSWTYDQQGNRLTQTNHDASGNTANDVTTTNTPIGGTGNTATGTNPGQPTHGMSQASSSNAAGPIAGSTINYTYDAAGNVTSRTNAATSTDTLTYDAEGELSQLATTGSATETTNYRYDASGKLLIRADNQNTVLFVGDTELTLAQGGTQATGVRYIAAGGAVVAVHDASGQVFYTIPNQQGTNTIEVSASNTSSVNRRSYTPYGQDRTTAASWMGDKGFVGGQRDDTTGLTNLGAREYDPATGKFLTPDPLVVSGDPQQWNAYAYADGSPVSKSDPTGNRSECGQNGDSACGDTGNPSTGGGTGTAYAGDPTYGCGGYQLSMGNCKLSLAQTTAIEQTAAAEAAARAREAATANAAAAAAKANKEGLIHKIISLVGDLIGVTDAVNCFTKGDVMGCISTALNFVPWGKLFEALKVGYEAFKVWRTIEHADEAIKAADDIEHAAVAAEDAARAEADAAKADEAAAKANSGPGCKGAHSFLAGTQVQLADGTTKNIEQVQPGDQVVATDPQAGISKAETVLALIVTTTDHDFTQLTLATTGHGAHAPPADKQHQTQPATAKLTTTWHHPFWNQTLHRWTNASELTTGTHLRQPDGTTVAVLTVRNYHTTAVTYDLTVADLHTYYVMAGATPILVHNSSGACDIPLKSLHPDSSLDKSSLDFWHKQDTEDIVFSLRPGAHEPLIAKPDGTIMNGNTRIAVLRSRGYDVDSLPREPYSGKTMTDEDFWDMDQ
jgi:RHS repeat-associated protein